MEVGTSAQAEPEIYDDNEFAVTVVDVEACALQYSAINLDVEQLNSNYVVKALSFQKVEDHTTEKA
uniref:Uncharacterized protein n=1 Tax=Romanomermis culicivorax TaxID=13658 RepID=A0A915KPH2_ROMCU